MVTLPEPEMIEAAPKVLVGLSDNYDMTRRGEIPQLYERFFALRPEMQTVISPVLYGVSMDARPDGSFRYGVGVEIDDMDAPQPKGACYMNLTGGTYARFCLRTQMTEMPQYFDKVFWEWLPASSFVMREGAVFELYPEDSNPENGAMDYEIWVPVVEKD